MFALVGDLFVVLVDVGFVVWNVNARVVVGRSVFRVCANDFDAVCIDASG